MREWENDNSIVKYGILKQNILKSIKYLKNLIRSARFQADLNIFILDFYMGEKFRKEIGSKVCRE